MYEVGVQILIAAVPFIGVAIGILVVMSAVYAFAWLRKNTILAGIELTSAQKAFARESIKALVLAAEELFPMSGDGPRRLRDVVDRAMRDLDIEGDEATITTHSVLAEMDLGATGNKASANAE